MEAIESAHDWLRPMHCKASKFAAMLMRKAPPDHCHAVVRRSREEFATHVVVTCCQRERVVYVEGYDQRTQERWTLGPWTPKPAVDPFSCWGSCAKGLVSALKK
jgi:hypothetical protein